MQIKDELKLKEQIEDLYTTLTNKVKKSLYNNNITKEMIDKNKIGMVRNVDKEEILNMKKENKEKYDAFKKAGIIKDNKLIIENRLFIPLWKNNKLANWVAKDLSEDNKGDITSVRENNLVSNCKDSNGSYIVGNIPDYYLLDLLGFEVTLIFNSHTKKEHDILRKINDNKILFHNLMESRELANKIWPENKLKILQFSEENSISAMFKEDYTKEEIKEYILNLESKNIFEINIKKINDFDSHTKEIEYFKKSIVPLLSKLEGIEKETYIKEVKEKLNTTHKYTIKSIKNEIDRYNKENSSDNKSNLATKIFKRVEKKLELFKDERGISYSRIPDGDFYKTVPLKSDTFRHWLKIIGQSINNGNIVNSTSIKACQEQLMAKAEHYNKVYKLYNRVGEKDDSFWYDLSNQKWQAVEINQEGWDVIKNPPTLFRRNHHSKAQVVPVKGGDPWELLDFVNIKDVDSRLLLFVYTISLFIPEIPHPILILHGTEGSAKSTLLEIIRMVIDPSRTPLLNIPTKSKELVAIFDHHYCAYFDNVSRLSKANADNMCKAVTGMGAEYRKLYSDDDSVIRNFKRCIALNGIDLASTESDLLDRSIMLEMKMIEDEDRKEIKNIKENFNSALPEILGGIFDTISKAMHVYPELELKSKPRMADFARWGYAIAEVSEYFSGDDFIEAYKNNEKDKARSSIKDNPFALAIENFIYERVRWEGTAEQLLKKIKAVAMKKDLNTNHKLWPSGPNWVTRRLNQIEASLKKNGVDYSHKNRIISLHYYDGARYEKEIFG